MLQLWMFEYKAMKDKSISLKLNNSETKNQE